MFNVIRSTWSDISENWQQTPRKFSAGQPLERDQVFDVFKVAARRFRDGLESAPGKIYADGINRSDDLEKYLPYANESFESYDHRMMIEYGHSNYLVYGFDLSPYDDKLGEALQALKHTISAGARQEQQWGPIVAEMFMGRYQATSGGIHKENCATLHYVLHGKKTIRVWPESTWDEKVETILQQKDVRTGEDEYFLVDAHFDDRADRCTDLTGTNGDIFYWPERWWHVGRSEDLTCALTVALHPAAPVEEAKS